MSLPDCVNGVTCPGHKEYDVLPMGDFLGNGDTYTNIEWYNFTRPWNPELPYVYDTYSSWPACAEQNIHFFTSASVKPLKHTTGGVASHIAAGHMKAGFVNDRRLTGMKDFVERRD